MTHSFPTRRSSDLEVLTLNRANEDHVQVRAPRASISIMTQPEVLRDYVEKRGAVAQGTGHWARYLVAWPQSNVGYRPVGDGDAAWECLPLFPDRVQVLLDLTPKLSAPGKAEQDHCED